MREIKFRAWDESRKRFIFCVFRDSSFWFDSGSDSDIKELLQFTGLKDKNGKEIYEGDIIRVSKGLNNWSIEWDDKAARYKLGNTHRSWLTQAILLTQGAEVIGNIYENPELLV